VLSAPRRSRAYPSLLFRYYRSSPGAPNYDLAHPRADLVNASEGVCEGGFKATKKRPYPGAALPVDERVECVNEGGGFAS